MNCRKEPERLKSSREMKVKMGITADQQSCHWPSEMSTHPSPKGLMQIHPARKNVTANP